MTDPKDVERLIEELTFEAVNSEVNKAFVGRIIYRLRALSAENERLHTQTDPSGEYAKIAAENKRLRSALFAIEVHGASEETYDPVVEEICREALEGSERDAAQAQVRVKPLRFDWRHDEYSPNPTCMRTQGDGFSAYVLIPYEGDNDPAQGTGTWNGVAQNRGQSGFLTQQDALKYCEDTIREFAQVSINRASNFLEPAPISAQAAAANWSEDVREQVLEALWQLLDDMGPDGLCVCLKAKKQAIDAYKSAFPDEPEKDWPTALAQSGAAEGGEG